MNKKWEERNLSLPAVRLNANGLSFPSKRQKIGKKEDRMKQTEDEGRQSNVSQLYSVIKNSTNYKA